MSATVSRVGTEILVNTATESFQGRQQITALSNGGFVITWQDQSQGVGGTTGDGSNSAVKAQVFLADGTRVGSELLVNTATDGGQQDPQITALSTGGFVVTWVDSSEGVGGAAGDTEITAVKAQVFTADGARLGSEFLVNTASEGLQTEQQITALSNGGFVVTWQDDSRGVGGATGDGSGTAVKAQVFAADGGRIDSEILVNTAVGDNQFNQRITALSNGGFVVTWDDESLGVGGATGDSNAQAVKAQVFTANGTRVGSELRVNTATQSDQRDAQITALSNGGFVVTWADESQGVGGATGDSSFTAVKAQVFAADGTRVGSELLVNTAIAQPQDTSKITALSGGGFVVTWEDNSEGLGGTTGDSSGIAVKAQVFTADGTRVGSELLVNTATEQSQDRPQITALSNGGFVVTWEDFGQGAGGATGDNSGIAVKAQVFLADGTRVGSELLVNTATVSSQNRPEITALSNGGFVVTWGDFSQGVGGTTGDSSDAAIKAQVFAIGISNNSPTITSNGGGATATVSVPESTFAATTVTANDPDNDPLTFSIVGGFDAAQFQIDPGTGALSFVVAPDFEAPTDSDANNSYLVQVRASDGTAFDTQAITVNVSDLGEAVNQAPAITSNGGGATATVSAAENTFAVTTVTANEPDNDPLTFSIVAGLDSAQFQINPETGALSFVVAPDFEAPTDGGANNGYVVQVRASDGTGFDDQTIIVNVSDVNEQPGPVPNPGGSALFDAAFYLSQNPDVLQAGVDPLGHFNTFGFREGRDPNPLFDTSGYLAVNKDVAAAGINPLDHFHNFGFKEGRDPSLAFDTTLYLLRNPDVAEAGIDPLEHFLVVGQSEGRVAHQAIGPSITGGFDAQFYLFDNPDVAAAGVDPFFHYDVAGRFEGRNPNAWFDTAGYLAFNTDVAAAGVNPLQHYEQFGFLEGRDPSASFDTLGYLAANPDVAAAGVNPLDHFLQFGIFEGRQAVNDGLFN